MTGTWPTARANIVTQLNALTADAGAAYASETLTALEFPPAAVQTSILPYCYIIPPGRDATRRPGRQRVTAFDAVQVRFILGGQGSNVEAIATRMEAWIEAILDAFDDAVGLDGTADVLQSQGFSGLQTFENEGWGFEMSLGLRLSETKTFSA